MQTQLDLTFPASRRTDPQTSFLAEKELNDTGSRSLQARQVLEVLMRNEGRTSRELAWIGEMDRYLVARRLPDLEKVGLARKGPARRCDQSGRKSVTWWTK